MLTACLTKEEAARLASEFDYVFAVCYGSCEAPNFETQQKNACLIDLRDGAGNAFLRFNASTRTHVRRAKKIENLSFRFGSGEDFESYFKFYKTCENARSWFPVPEEELRNSLVCTAFFDGNPISGMSAYSHENQLRIGRIFSLKNTSHDEQLNNLVFGCAAKQIVFELCQYGAANGFQSLDLSGIDLHDPAKAGITKFKLSFGGLIVPVTIARFANARFRELEPRIREAGYDIT